MKQKPGAGTDLDQALVRAGRYLCRGVVSADLRTLLQPVGYDEPVSSELAGELQRSLTSLLRGDQELAKVVHSLANAG